MPVNRNPEAAMMPFGRVIDSSVLTAALVDPTPATSKAVVRDTAAHSVQECQGWSRARIMFGGSDAADEAFNYQVILWSNVTSGENTETWIPRVIASGLVTLGTDVYAAAGLGAVANFFADTITETLSEGATVYQPANLRAILEVPLLNAERLEIQTDIATAATADVFVQLGESGNLVPKVDQVSGATLTIEHAHGHIHEGKSFHVGYSVTTASSDDDVTAIMFKTPNTLNRIHLTATFNASSPAEAIINEAPTLATPAAGSDKVVLNRDRNSTETSTVASLETSPTVGSVTTMTEAEWTSVGVSAGTELEHEFHAGGEGPFAVGGVSRGSQEWDLKQDTIYVFYLQNTGANANAHSISLDWYEHVSL